MEENIELALKLFNNNDFNKALQLFLKELKEIKNGKSCSDIAEILDYIGQSYRHLKHFNKAIKYLEEALNLTKESNQIQTCNLLRNLGSCYSANGNHIESLRCLEKSLRIAREIKDKEGEAGLLYEIGTLYIDSGKNKKALDVLKKSLTIYETIGLKKKADKVRREIRELELDLKEFELVMKGSVKYKRFDYNIY
ncbi:MAG: tetratricopeptide repeat protein [Candidatus Helarchaeota archaeon]